VVGGGSLSACAMKRLARVMTQVSVRKRWGLGQRWTNPQRAGG
jgi:hypothetical protein